MYDRVNGNKIAKTILEMLVPTLENTVMFRKKTVVL
jgi:hypothetical protein